MPLLTANGAFELGKKPPEFAQAVLPTSVISILKKKFYFNFNSIFPNNFILISNFHFTENSYFNFNSIL